MICGTSLGALVALLILKEGHNIDNLISFVKQYMAQTSNWLNKIPFLSEDYNFEAVSHFLTERFGNKHLCDFAPNKQNHVPIVIAIATDCTHDNHTTPFLFHNMREQIGKTVEGISFLDESEIEICRAACACAMPSQQKPYFIAPRSFVDGCIVASNPAFYALRAATFCHDEQVGLLLSLGSGVNKDKYAQMSFNSVKYNVAWDAQKQHIMNSMLWEMMPHCTSKPQQFVRLDPAFMADQYMDENRAAYWEQWKVDTDKYLQATATADKVDIILFNIQ